MNIIDKLKNSGIPSLEQKSSDVEKWAALRHTKEDLELFLNFNLAEIRFKTLDGKDSTIVCTSNTTVIRLFSFAKDHDKEKLKQIASGDSKGIKTKNKRTIDTWDLIDNRIKTMSLSSWQIIDFISISPANMLDLHFMVNTLLKR